MSHELRRPVHNSAAVVISFRHVLFVMGHIRSGVYTSVAPMIADFTIINFPASQLMLKNCEVSNITASLHL